MPAIIVTGLGFGDEGKGTVVDHLVRSNGANEVVFFNGGAQRAHNVVLPDGRHHTFNQFSSGTFVPGVKTHHSQFSLVNPHELFIEAQRLAAVGVDDAIARLSVHADALITTPFHIATNRMKEIERGKGRHGSCGMGIGETAWDDLNGRRIQARDLHDPKALREKLWDLQVFHKRQWGSKLQDAMLGSLFEKEGRALTDAQVINEAMEIYRIFAKVVPIYDDYGWDLRNETVVFEGSQGVLLDEWRGFHPYTTWSKTTSDNARTILSRYNPELIRHIGVTRTYATRHGAGPLPTESERFDFPEGHNAHGRYQGGWRQGYLDFNLLKYAREADQPDEVAVTHCDLLSAADEWEYAFGYTMHQRLVHPKPPKERDKPRQTRLTECLEHVKPLIIDANPSEIPEMIARTMNATLGMTSDGPTHEHKQVRDSVLV